MFKFKIVDYSLAMASQLALAACSHVDHSKCFVFTDRENLRFRTCTLIGKASIQTICVFLHLVVVTMIFSWTTCIQSFIMSYIYLIKV